MPLHETIATCRARGWHQTVVSVAIYISDFTDQAFSRLRRLSVAALLYVTITAELCIFRPGIAATRASPNVSLSALPAEVQRAEEREKALQRYEA